MDNETVYLNDDFQNIDKEQINVSYQDCIESQEEIDNYEEEEETDNEPEEDDEEQI